MICSSVQGKALHVTNCCMCSMPTVSMQHARAGVTPGLLFDWAIPLMTAFVTDAAQPDEGSVYWALSALQHGMQGCDDKAVTRYGNALLDACQRLLEADTLPEHLLPLLLPVISQVQSSPQLKPIATAAVYPVGTTHKDGKTRRCSSDLWEHADRCNCLQASRAEHSFRAHFQDLVELLVGWSFEPKLTDMQR